MTLRTLSSLALLLAIALGIAPSPSGMAQDGRDALTRAEVAAASSEGRGLSPTVAALRGTPHALARQGRTGAGTGTAARRVGVPQPSGGVGTALIGGWATFYEDPNQRIDHYAAAGKLLRDALGHWRGKVIRVTSGQHSTIVALLDSCQCGKRHGLPTLLDLSPAAFKDLAPLSAGIVRVEIELVALPATDALPRNANDLRLMLEVGDDHLYAEPVQ